MHLKFLFVALCFAVALVSYFFCKCKKDWAWLVLGLLFTLGADYFLVLRNWHLPGVAIFCFAHMCYILRPLKGKRIYVLVPVVALIAIAFANGWLVALSGIYAGLFMANIFINVKHGKTLPNRLLVIGGLILFALCDVNVLLFNLPRQFNFPVTFPWAFTLIWVFYLPAQALLAISGIRFGKLGEFAKERF